MALLDGILSQSEEGSEGSEDSSDDGGDSAEEEVELKDLDSDEIPSEDETGDVNGGLEKSMARAIPKSSQLNNHHLQYTIRMMMCQTIQ